jgi:hypothetical protein
MLKDSRITYGQNLISQRSPPFPQHTHSDLISLCRLTCQAKVEAAPKKFTHVIRELDTVYPEKALADISTSFCFICLLHLANEKGLKIEGSDALDELNIVRDIAVEGTDSF